MLQKKNNMVSSKSIVSVKGSQKVFKEGSIKVGNKSEFVNLKVQDSIILHNSIPSKFQVYNGDNNLDEQHLLDYSGDNQ